jgi:perosamine synthetase
MSNLAILGGEPVRDIPFPIRRTMGELEKQAVLNVMESDQLSGFFGSPGDKWLGGEQVKAFEAKWASMYGFKHAISVNSWTTGLMTAVGAVGIEPGDEVIVSPYTMSASATAILFYGGIPIFADIDPDTFNITAETIESVISPRTKGIMVVHIFGQAADMDPIMALAKKYNLKVIEDAAQSPGVFYKGKPVGAIGDIGGFSLNYHKHIHAGEGGMLVTNDDKYALRCQLIRNHAENLVEAQGINNLMNMIGSNYRLTEIGAAIGNCQLDQLEGYLLHRQKLANYFSAQLEQIPGLGAAKISDGSGHAYYLYPIKFDEKIIGVSRGDFVRAVNAELPKPEHWEQTCLVEGYVRPLYLLPVYQKKIALGSKGFPWSTNSHINYAYKSEDCPNVERIYKHEMIFTPLIREPLTDRDIEDVVKAIRKVIKKSNSIIRNG